MSVSWGLYSLWSILFFFFFSSRRRHTRFDCDWSSDVCSSDLDRHRPGQGGAARFRLSTGEARLRHPVARQSAGDLLPRRSEEHTSELQSQSNLVCRLLLEKKKKTAHYTFRH